jgi:hypothetical protein
MSSAAPAEALGLADGFRLPDLGEFVAPSPPPGQAIVGFGITSVAKKLSALGYGIERDGNSFRLKGLNLAKPKNSAR